MFGGLNGIMLNDTCIFNIQKWKWYYIKFERNEQQPEPRFGHSSVVYKSSVYVYGGYRRYNKSFKIRETYGDVYEFSTESLKWDKIRWSGQATFRRHHVAETIGKYMLIHGGIDHKSWVIDDICILNLETKSWSEVRINTLNPGKMSHHKSWLVIHPIVKEKGFDLFSSYKSNRKLDEPLIKEGGMYIFGGINENGESLNDLWVLKVGREILFWTKPDTKGRAPPPRFSHSMHYIEFMNWIMIFGGRCSEPINADAKQYFYNDFWLLKVDTLEWVKIPTKGELPSPMYAHCSCVNRSEFITFGGMNEHHYNDFNYHILELHTGRSKELNEKYEEEK